MSNIPSRPPQYVSGVTQTSTNQPRTTLLPGASVVQRSTLQRYNLDPEDLSRRARAAGQQIQDGLSTINDEETAAFFTNASGHPPLSSEPPPEAPNPTDAEPQVHPNAQEQFGQPAAADAMLNSFNSRVTDFISRVTAIEEKLHLFIDYQHLLDRNPQLANAFSSLNENLHGAQPPHGAMLPPPARRGSDRISAAQDDRRTSPVTPAQTAAQTGPVSSSSSSGRRKVRWPSQVEEEKSAGMEGPATKRLRTSTTPAGPVLTSPVAPATQPNVHRFTSSSSAPLPPLRDLLPLSDLHPVSNSSRRTPRPRAPTTDPVPLAPHSSMESVGQLTVSGARTMEHPLFVCMPPNNYGFPPSLAGYLQWAITDEHLQGHDLDMQRYRDIPDDRDALVLHYNQIVKVRYIRTGLISTIKPADINVVLFVKHEQTDTVFPGQAIILKAGTEAAMKEALEERCTPQRSSEIGIHSVSLLMAVTAMNGPPTPHPGHPLADVSRTLKNFATKQRAQFNIYRYQADLGESNMQIAICPWRSAIVLQHMPNAGTGAWPQATEDQIGLIRW